MKVEKNHLRKRSCLLASAKRLFNGALLLSLLFLVGSCSNEFDDYYERPGWLEDDAYEVLKKKGNFTNYLKLVDKTLFAKVVHGSGSYTFFAPNDEAFETYLRENNLKSVDDISDEKAAEIVSFTMVYNQYESARLGDSWVEGEWGIGSSVRKRTPSYKTIYKDLVNGDSVYVYDLYVADFSEVWHNYRYLPIFTPAYLSANGLNGVEDYIRVFDTPWSSHGNVLDAEIVNVDIYASNGVVHELNKVIEPIKNMDEMIMQYANEPSRSTEGWSEFKKLLLNKNADGSYQFLSYVENQDAATYFKKMYPSMEAELSKVYTKIYSNLMLMAMNIEEYVYTESEIGDSPEVNAYTLFMPSDVAIKDYVKNTLLKYTEDFNELPADVLETFLLSHFSRGLVWPNLYKTAKNPVGSEGEFINGVGAKGPGFEEAGILTSQFATNGLVYTLDRVIKAGLFESVYGRVLLDPAYSYVHRLLNGGTIYQSLIRTPYSGYASDSYVYTLLLPSNDLLEADGFSYNSVTSAFENSVNAGTASARINRLVNNGIFMREVSVTDAALPTPLDNFETQPEALQGAYDGYGFAVNNYGDMIRYKNNQVQAVGNIQDGTVVNIVKDPTEYVNGQVYTIDKLLNYTPRDTYGSLDTAFVERSVVSFINDYLSSHDDASVFKRYWDACFDDVNATINSSGFYTILIPTNDRVNEAIAAGLIPNSSEISENMEAKQKATAFVNAHLILGAVYPDDGLERIYPGNYPSGKYKESTSLKITEGSLDLVMAKTYAIISKRLIAEQAENNHLCFTAADIDNGNSIVVIGYNSEAGTNSVVRDINDSNVMGPRAVIHKFDGYLYFAVNEELLTKE